MKWGTRSLLSKHNKRLTLLKYRMDKVGNLTPCSYSRNWTLQPTRNAVQSPVAAPQQVQRDEKAEVWREDNSWFGDDDEMTAFALGLAHKLTKEGTRPSIRRILRED